MSAYDEIVKNFDLIDEEKLLVKYILGDSTITVSEVDSYLSELKSDYTWYNLLLNLCRNSDLTDDLKVFPALHIDPTSDIEFNKPDESWSIIESMVSDPLTIRKLKLLLLRRSTNIKALNQLSQIIHKTHEED